MADRMQVKIEGLDDLQKDFKRLTEGFKPEEVKEAAVEAAQTIRDEAERRAPLGPTGNLKKSNVVKPLSKDNKRPAAIAAVDRRVAPHAHFIEFGTSKMTAKPFFRPAVELEGPKAAEKFKDNLEKLVEKAVKNR